MPDEMTPSPAPRMAPIAIVSLVLAILSFFCGGFLTAIPAVVCGHIARSKIRKSNGALRGKEIATASLIAGYIALPWAVLQVIFLVGLIQGDRDRLHDLDIKRQEILSDDGKMKVTTSGFWVKKTDLNKQALLQAARPDKEMYVIVLSDPKSTVTNVTLQQRHQAASDHKLQQMSNSSASAPVPVTINGHPALQDELSGTQNGSTLTFLHTTVDDGDSFDQIIAWTLKSRWAKQNAELREVTNSFHSMSATSP